MHSPPQPKYWTYELCDGWQVFAGKTDFDNDLVSFELALPTDHWFHLSGAPGSHVLLRGPAGEEPTREQLCAAANIAAWHSKARKATRCNVDYCLARYVTKPPRVPAGMVHISHAKTIKAHPELPAPSTK